MNKTTYTVTRFDVNEDFYVEVSPSKDKNENDMYDFVLCMKNYGIKDFMFGLFAKDCHPDTWEEMIENNIEEYIDGFYKNIYDVFESGFLEEHGFYDNNTNQ